MHHTTFVVLHYITFTDTVDCVESILNNIKCDYYNVIIVDNGSPNNSGKLLYERYQNNDKVFVILLENNIGFANGNNIGYKLAKITYGSDFIIFINNDTLVFQEDFIEKIIEKYKLTQFDILGPDIVSLVDGSHQNPVRLTGFTKKELIIWVLYISLLLLLNYLRIENIIRRIKQVKFKYEKKTIPYGIEQRNVQLHGSCLVFSSKYINRFEGLCSKTFMYMEEDILNYQAKKFGLLSLYTPDVVIFHKEDTSTNSKFDEDYKIRRFKYKNVLISSRVLLNLMNQK